MKEERKEGRQEKYEGRREGEGCYLLEASLMMHLSGLPRHRIGKPQSHAFAELVSLPKFPGTSSCSCGPNTGCWCQAGCQCPL